MSNSPSPLQKTLGYFLLGTAALALFNLWFPGILWVVGGCWLYYRREHGHDWRKPSAGWGLLVVGGVYWLRDVLYGVAPAYVFPAVMVALAVVIFFAVDLSEWDA